MNAKRTRRKVNRGPTGSCWGKHVRTHAQIKPESWKLLSKKLFFNLLANSLFEHNGEKTLFSLAKKLNKKKAPQKMLMAEFWKPEELPMVSHKKSSSGDTESPTEMQLPFRSIVKILQNGIYVNTSVSIIPVAEFSNIFKVWSLKNQFVISPKKLSLENKKALKFFKKSIFVKRKSQTNL